jgi:hypothetical protein
MSAIKNLLEILSEDEYNPSINFPADFLENEIEDE